MKILTDMAITLHAEDVIRSYGGESNKNKTWLTREARRSVRLASSLIEPAIGYRFLALESVENEAVALADELTGERVLLQVGRHIDLLCHAGMAMIALYTIGSSLETTVGELHRKNRFLESYLLDCSGLLALELVAEEVKRIAEEEAKGRQWGLSGALSPGGLEGWDITGQGTLCSLLQPEKIGVSVSETNVLHPFKSVTMLIGLGPMYTANKVGSTCRFCRLRATCPKQRRKTEDGFSRDT